MNARRAYVALGAALALALVPGLATARIAAPTLVAPAVFEEAQPPVGSTAWYWEPQTSQPITDPTTGADYAVIELANPWCPSTPIATPEQTCREGRLPVEVIAGDYETPDKMSAIGFDLALVPIGSEVRKFTVLLREAPPDEAPPSFNHEEKKVQACLVLDFFGDGVAREYKEAPKFECSDTDPMGKRKEVTRGKGNNEETFFAWQFDLTAFAQQWVEGTSPATAILLRPAPPENKDDPGAVDPRDHWRVVFAGPVARHGVQTSLVYDPPAPQALPGGGGSSGDGFTGSTGSSGSTGSGFGSVTTTGDAGTGADTPVSDATPGATPSPAPTTSPIGAEGEPAEEQGLPWYVWASLLMGLIALSAVKNVVLESTTGIRPDGVLAQIRRLNGGRSAAAAAVDETSRSPLAAIGGAFRSAGRVIGRPFRRS